MWELLIIEISVCLKIVSKENSINMVKMIPNYIDQEDSRLNGERIVFDLLSKLDNTGIALHSVWQKNQNKKLFGEIDFLLITKRGLLCLEVKGGIVGRENGEWYSITKNDKKVKIHNPFKQAQDCMYSLKKQLKNIPKFKDAIIGMGVIFPECIFNAVGNDLTTEVIFDYNYNGSFKDYIANTYKYWEEEYLNKQNIKGKILSEDDICSLHKILRADFQAIPSMNSELDFLGKQIVLLTEEQNILLNDLMEENERLLIQGVAGTGKSIIAIERTQQLIASGINVAYMCFNKNMADYAKRKIGNIPESSFIGTFNSLLNQYLPDYDKNIKLPELCSSFLKNNIKPKQYDVLIIDEAQDLMNLNIIEVLSLFLKQGIELGNWALFFDPNQNIFQHSESFDETVEYLKKGCGAFLFKLYTNCRNTKQIAEKVASVTKTGAARIMNITGQDVIIEPYESEKDLISKLKYRIQSLITSGIKPGNIIILSKYKLQNSGLKNVSNICNCTLKEMHGLPETDTSALKYYTVQSFKGLDSDIVFYIDIDGFGDLNNRMLNYVGMSRAKILLYAFYKKEAINDLSSFILLDS